MNSDFIFVLGTAQDGGFPHVGCDKDCCSSAIKNLELQRLVSSIAIIDDLKKCFWMIDSTPDFKSQLSLLSNYINHFTYPYFSGIFLTHAHMGHYSGLLNLGLEVMNLRNIPVYVLSGMKHFLMGNSIFYNLVKNKNIAIKEMVEDKPIILNDNISIVPFQVPHRNELSETVGFKVISENRSVIYIPDIDSWEEWDENIIDIISGNNISILDGTFFSKEEINYRNTQKIPHPTINESILKFNSLDHTDRKKVFFTHLNHTNRALDQRSDEYKYVITSGYNILKDGQIIQL